MINMEHFSEPIPKSTTESLSEFPRFPSLQDEGFNSSGLELQVDLRRVTRACDALSRSQRLLQELLAGSISIKAIEVWVTLFEKVAEALSNATSNLREVIKNYNRFVEQCAASYEEIERNLVFVTGEMRGIGIVIDFQRRSFVLTCAHVVGRRSPRNILIQNPYQGQLSVIRVQHTSTNPNSDVAILSIAPPREKGLRLDTELMSELYLRSTPARLKTFYWEDSDVSARCNSRDGYVKRVEGHAVVVDLGHVKLGESGSPAFFEIGNERWVLTGILCARRNERMLKGAQTVEAVVVKMYPILQTLSKIGGN